LQALIDNAKPDPANKNARQLQGNYLNPFTAGIKKQNAIDFRLQHKHGRVYPSSSRGSTPFLTINAYCLDCKNCGNKDFVRFKIMMIKNPFTSLNETELAANYINA